MNTIVTAGGASAPTMQPDGGWQPLLKSELFGLGFDLGIAPLLHTSLFTREPIILMYHGLTREPLAMTHGCFVPEAMFTRQMEYLARYFDVVPLTEAVRRLDNGGARRPTVVLTFDDGFQSVCDIALPVLRRLGLPATIFICTGHIGRSSTIWFCRLLQALLTTHEQRLAWSGQVFDLHDWRAREAAGASIEAQLKRLDHDDLEHEVDTVIAALGLDPAMDPLEPFRILDRDSLARLQISGLFEIGAHTVQHAILTHVSPERARAEIVESVRATAELTGEPCELFAYPNGRPEDYDAVALSTLADVGVKAAVTTRYDTNKPSTPRLELRRYYAGPYTVQSRLGQRAQAVQARLSRRIGRR